MDQKMMKIVAIILGALCLLALIFAFSYVIKYGSLESEYRKLEDNNRALSVENDNLAQKASFAQVETDKLRLSLAGIQAELDKAASLRDELQKKIDEIASEKAALIEKLDKALANSSQTQGASAQPLPSGQAEDQYWMGILKEKAELEVQVANLKDMLKNAQIKTYEIIKDKIALDLDFQKAASEKDELQRNLEYNARSLDAITMQLYKEKEDRRKIQEQAGLFKQENYALKNRLKAAMNNKVTLEKRVRELEQRDTELSRRLNQMDQVFDERVSSIFETKREIEELKKSSFMPSSGSTIELSPIVVRSQTENIKGPDSQAGGSLVSPGMSVSGKILSVNIEDNFVVVDIGEDRGLKEGMLLGIYRGEQQIGSLQVIQVKANVCAADIKEKYSDIRVGDTVK